MKRHPVNGYTWLIVRTGFLLLVVLGATPRAHSQDDGILKVTLLDPTGGAMAYTSIEVRWNDLHPDFVRQGRTGKAKRPHKKWVRGHSDTSGGFSVRLTPGQYDIFAYSDGFLPTCASVGVMEGKTMTLELHFPNAIPHIVSKMSGSREAPNF